MPQQPNSKYRSTAPLPAQPETLTYMPLYDFRLWDPLVSCWEKQAKRRHLFSSPCGHLLPSAALPIFLPSLFSFRHLPLQKSRRSQLLHLGCPHACHRGPTLGHALCRDCRVSQFDTRPVRGRHRSRRCCQINNFEASRSARSNSSLGSLC